MENAHQVDLLRIFKIFGADEIEPRTIAIVGTAYIEAHLSALVRKNLPGLNSDLSKRLFGPEGPLGSLAALIDMARALNLLSNRGRNEAKKIARVRNRFAHRIDIEDFDHPAVASIIDSMDAHRGFRLTEDGNYDVDNKNMSRRERVTYLMKEFCLSIERHLTGQGDWMVAGDDLHVEPHPPSPEKSRGRSRLPPEALTNDTAR